MFGQPNNNNTPFGSSSGFGQAPAPAFGAPAPAAGGLFGSSAPAPAFGAPAAPATGGLWGAPAPTGGFGAPAPAPFGQPAPAAPAFGQPAPAPGLFGAPAPAFGAAPAPAFGAAPAPAFGAPAPATGGLFGAPAPAFGAPAPAFGAPAPAPTGGLFGAPAPAPTGIFGAPAATPFGSPAPAPFGAAPAPAFGAPAPTGLWGSSTPPAPAPFGQAAPAFGAPAPAFGATPAAPAGGLFAGSPTAGGGTAAVAYSVTPAQDGGAGQIKMHNVSAMAAYVSKSQEELRMEDYAAGNKGSSAPAAGGFGSTGFGSPAPAPTGLFGSNPAPAPFGSPAPAPFGAAPAPAFGGSTFGAAPAPAFGAAPTSTFGAPATTGGLFGSSPTPAPAFGAPAPTTGFGAPAAPATGGLFGSTAPAPAFGAAPAPAFGSPAPAFGAPAPTTGLFGTPAPAPTGLFGTPAPAPTTGFFGGAAPAPSAFGAPSTGLFGQPAAAPFGAKPPGTGLFGSPAPAFGQAAPAPQATFAQPPAAPTALFPSGAQIIAPAHAELLAAKLQAVEYQKKSLEKVQGWNSPSPPKAASTPTSATVPESFFSASKYQSVATPSRASIRPRGVFPRSENSKLQTSFPKPDNTGTLTPGKFALSAKQTLVVDQASLNSKTRKSASRLSVDVTVTDEPLPEIEPAPDGPPLHRTPMARGLPPKSPAQAYYDEIVADTGDESKDNATTTTETALVVKSSVVPTLTKPDYEVTPSIEDLTEMSEADLAAVPNFSVSRPGVGMIEWEGAVDVRGADLDRIVEIEEKDVAVYNLDEEQGRKPVAGSKLNRPAKITFYNVFPKGGADVSDAIKAKFALRVERNSARIGAEFISYDRDTGVWEIRVQHFSRYALDDESSDEEEEQVLPSPLAQRNVYRPPTKRSRISGVLIEEETELKEEEMEETALAVYRASLWKPEQEAVEDTPAISYEDEDCSVTVTVVGEEVETLDVPTITNTVVSKVQQTAAACGVFGGSTSCGTFSCSWSSKLTLLMPFPNNAGAVTFEPQIPKSSLNLSTTDILFKGALASCDSDFVDEYGCSVFVTKYNENHVLPRELDPTSDEALAFYLVENLLPGGDEDRRLEAARVLLGRLCTKADTEAVPDDDAMARMFQATANGNQVSCNPAMDGCEDLELLLLSGQDSQSAVLNYLAEHSNTEADKLTNEHAKRMLYNFGRGDTPENDEYKRVDFGGKKKLSWMQRLLLRIEYNQGGSLSDVIRAYEDDAKKGLVPFPYFDATARRTSLFFRLLKYCSDPDKVSLAETLDPNGWTFDPQDYSLSFHLAVFLALRSPELPGFDDFERISGHFEEQLLAAGLYKWAVFVALCTFGYPSEDLKLLKAKRAYQIVMKYYREDDKAARAFLMDKLGLPGQWFQKAVFLRKISQSDLPGLANIADDMDDEYCLKLLTDIATPRYFEAAEPHEFKEWLRVEAEAFDLDDRAPLAVILRVFAFEDRLNSIVGQLDERQETEVAKIVAGLTKDLQNLCHRPMDPTLGTSIAVVAKPLIGRLKKLYASHSS